MTTPSMRGITLLISVILSSVVLSVALALLDISYKQQLLASTAKQSQKAFYNADTAMECALYWDQQFAAFDYVATTYLTNGFTCNGQTIVITPSSWAPVPQNSSTVAGGTRTTFFNIPCNASLGQGTGLLGQATIVKSSSGATTVYTSGYSSCDTSDQRRIERGLKILY